MSVATLNTLTPDQIRKMQGGSRGTTQAATTTSSLGKTQTLPTLPGLPALPGTTAAAGAGTGTGVASGAAGLPPDITSLKIEGSAPKELTDLNASYQKQLADVEAGRSREANVFKSGLDSDIERQVASAKEQALAQGQPFDEAAVRAEFTRGKNKALVDFSLGTQKEALASTREGLDVAKAPFEAELASKGLAKDTEALVMNYALGRGSLMNDAEKNEILRAGQAMDAYTAMVRALASLAA